MQFQYGGYTHADAEINFAGIQRQVVYSQTQRANILREIWSLNGKIVKQGAGSSAAVFATLTAIRAAYSVDGQTAQMIGTPWKLDTNQSIGGVVVTNPVSHGKVWGAEGVTYLHYTVGLMADSFLSGTNTLLSYSEQINFSNNYGRPLQIGRLPVTGSPIVQNVTTSSFYYATQSGMLTRRTPDPLPENMIWPDQLIGDPDSWQVTQFSPKTERGTPLEYGVRWNYKYRSISPLFGSPHPRG